MSNFPLSELVMCVLAPILNLRILFQYVNVFKGFLMNIVQIHFHLMSSEVQVSNHPLSLIHFHHFAIQKYVVLLIEIKILFMK